MWYLYRAVVTIYEGYMYRWRNSLSRLALTSMPKAVWIYSRTVGQQRGVRCDKGGTKRHAGVSAYTHTLTNSSIPLKSSSEIPFPFKGMSQSRKWSCSTRRDLTTNLVITHRPTAKPFGVAEHIWATLPRTGDQRQGSVVKKKRGGGGGGVDVSSGL